MGMCVSVHAHVCADPLELELWVVVSYLTWDLGRNLGPLYREASTPNC